MKNNLKYVLLGVLLGVLAAVIICVISLGAIKLFNSITEVDSQVEEKTISFTSEYGVSTRAPLGIKAEQYIKNMEKAGIVGKSTVSESGNSTHTPSEPMLYYTCEYEEGVRLEFETDKDGNVYEADLRFSSKEKDFNICKAFLNAYNKSIPEEVLTKMQLVFNDGGDYTYYNNGVSYYVLGGTYGSLMIGHTVEYIND